MADEQTLEIKDADVRSLGQKLEKFAEELPLGERAALLGILAAARDAGDDDVVKGYSAGIAGMARGDLTGLSAGKISPIFGGASKFPIGPLQDQVQVEISAEVVSGSWTKDI